MTHRSIKLLALFSTLVIPAWMFAQAPVQTIRGTVLDVDTRQPLFGATVVVMGTVPVLGASTDPDGRFIIPEVPVGRHDVQVRMIGYGEQVLSSILLNTAKETVLSITLEPAMVAMQEVEIMAPDQKGTVRNEMAIMSARTISVEETSRIAGGINDPARMVTTFPGVAGDPAGNNTIVVRGNSPRGVLWRMEGVEIPNPNHFTEEGSTGGAISVLNSDVIDDSEFYTGAFTAEYGNVTSAVFDMHLRKGNDSEQEYTIKAGVLGTDITAEGPIQGLNGGSYLANFRYSTLSLLDQAGIVDYQGVPTYSDAAFNVQLPTGNAGRFSVFGLGGKSSIAQQDRGVTEDTLFSSGEFGSRMGIAGVTHTALIGDRGFLYSTVTVNGNSSTSDYQEVPVPGEDLLEDRYSDELNRWTLRASTVLNQRINLRTSVRNGIIVSVDNYRMFSEAWKEEEGAMVTDLASHGKATTVQAFSSWKWRWHEQWTLVGGLHLLHYTLNGSTSLEPRAAVRWQQRPDRAFSLGAGLHSRTESIMTYTAQTTGADGLPYRPNASLGLSKAAHVVLGFEQQVMEDAQFKAELYYQHLHDLPVENDPTSSFCLNNYEGWFTTRTLANEGIGHNYGIELSVEKFFAHGWHAMITASASNAIYRPLDGTWYNGRFNIGAVVNVLAGREWRLGGAEQDRTLNAGFRYSLVGGQYATPIDLDASIDAGTEVEGSPAWSEKGEMIHKLDLVVSYRVGRPKVSHEIKADVQNVLNAQTVVYRYFDPRTERIGTVPQLALLPVLQYTLRF